jgi:hypothetical protein
VGSGDGDADSGAAETETSAQNGAPSEVGEELSSSDQFVVARAKTAFDETIDDGRASKETREQAEELIALCRKDPARAYGGEAVWHVIEQEAAELDEVAPDLAEELREELSAGCE